MKEALQAMDEMRTQKVKYPLDLMNVGEDMYTLMSKGHHDLGEFARHVKDSFTKWPLGIPYHCWVKAIPPPKQGYKAWYVECAPTTRGCLPATCCTEDYSAESKEWWSKY